MSHPQPKLPTAAELIELHSKARVLYAQQVHPLLAKTRNIRALSNADARAQVARLR